LERSRSRSIFFNVVSALAAPSPDRTDLPRRSLAKVSASFERSLLAGCLRSDPDRVGGLVIVRLSAC
jgi:hypothetical protein